MGRLVALACCVLLALTFLSSTAGAAPKLGTPCGATPGLTCLEVDVPLDRTGVVPGTIALHVEVLPPQGISRGVMFLVAGGPGQGSAHVFNLSSSSQAALMRFLFPGYTLVAYDDRGTGASALIDCPVLQTALTADAQRAAAGQCASIIGSGRVFYGTADHAEDLDAVRQALGADKVALFGVSYGTKLSLAYALAHPDHVERLVLDSVLAPEQPDPYSADVLRRMPGTLDNYCSDGTCAVATRNFGGDVAAVANGLAAKPLVGQVLLTNGRSATQRVDGLGFLSIVLDADLNPGEAAELPAVVHAARLGNTQPLLRLARLHDGTAASSAVSLSTGLYAATVCRDGPFPWAPDTPIGSRQSIFNSAVSGLPPGSFGPFGTWAARFGNADFCLAWPSPSGGGTLGAGPLPNVPLLELSGGFDMRTPTQNAIDVAKRFPQSQLLVVPGVGHSVTTADPSFCAAQGVRAWILSGTAPSACPRPKPIVATVPAFPAAGPASPTGPRSPLATYAIASAAVRDAEALWLMSSPAPAPGLYGGKVANGQRSITLQRYSIARGVTVSGTLRLTKTDLPFTFAGTLTVSGPGAATGILGLSGTSLRGTLGGSLVGR